MFCSPECKRNSIKNFHQFECSVMDLVHNPLLTSTMKIALRVFFIALSLFESSIENFEKFLSDNGGDRTMFDVESPCEITQKLLIMHSMTFSDEVAVNEIVFEEIFQASSVLKKLFLTHGIFIKKFLKKQTQIGTMNSHEIHNWPLKKGGLSDGNKKEFSGSLAYESGIVPVGSGGYPFLSLLNHSCSPNVNRIFIDNMNILVVQRPIKNGDQLFDDYGYNFTNMTREHRQIGLLKQYRFGCCCEACVNEWPLLSELKIIDKSLFNKAKKACRELSLGAINQKKAKMKFQEICNFIECAQKLAPSLEIYSMMQSASAYLQLIIKPVFQFE